MKRKTVIRAIAIIFIFLSIEYLRCFFLPLLGESPDKNLNPTYLVYTFILLATGLGLFNLKAFGRISALVLLPLRVIINFLFLIKVLPLQDELFAFNFYGMSFLQTEGKIGFIIYLMVWVLAAVLMITFLMERETKSMFSSDTVLLETKAA